MRVECPACGQRIEMVGRQVYCPNCGQLVEARFETPLPPRPSEGGKLEELEVVSEPQAPKPYVPPPPEPPHRQTPPWLPATILILCCFIGIFILMYVAMVRVASYVSSSAPPPPAPVVTAPPPPPPATQGDQSGSKLFSFQTPTTPAPQPKPIQSPSPAPATLPTEPITPPPPPAFKVAVAAAPVEEVVTDEAINNAIVKGVSFLIPRFVGHRLQWQEDQQAGAHALCTLALMHAGQATGDERLNIHNPFMIALIEQMKKFDVPANCATYTRSLRAQALAVYNRSEDRLALAAETRWLISNGVKGAYGYKEPPSGATQPSAISWDNSNSQYGGLGVWAAAEAGVAIPGSYWTDLQQHWEQSQTKGGGWEYSSPSGEGTLSMTAAGVNMLFVANEMLSATRPDVQIARSPFSPSLQLGLDWLAQGDRAIALSGSYTYYTLYGMERAGLACGFKMFGPHDWFRELAAQTLKKQGENGSWGSEVDTAFALLFLSRGRHPLMMNKLHFVGAWANRPRDVAHLAKFVSKETERPLNWQVVSLSSDWSDWMDSPVLYLASHEAPIFDEGDYAKLKSFVQAGGLLFTQADGGNKEFNQWADLLAMKLFNQELKDLPADHFIYNAFFRPKERFPLRAVSNGTRLLMVHSADDIAKRWQSKPPQSDRAVYELGANIFVYATGQEIPRNRVDSPFVADLGGQPGVTVPLARLQHDGDWDPEPWAWVRESRIFRRETSIGLDPKPIEIEKLTTAIAPVAHLTSTSAISLSEAQIIALREYVKSGGVLLIDACGGATPTRDNVRELAGKILADKKLADLPTDHPLLAGRGDGLTQLAKPQVRPYVFAAIGQKFPKLQIAEFGKGAVILSELDLTSGLLGTKTLGIVGYDPAYASAFVRNVILWTINGRGPVTPWKN